MAENKKDIIGQLTGKFENLSITEVLKAFAIQFPGKTTFSTSFSFEDQVITNLILSQNIPISIFTLDTGRLFPETYSVWSRTNEKYNIHVKAFYPMAKAIQEFVTEKGPNSFYESVDNRKGCCYLRKVEPLRRALQGNQVWVTGLRAEHSPDRQDLQSIEWDETNQVIKYHPLLYWTTEEVKDFITTHNIPYNVLHDRGFISIGCAPCTRAVQPGQDFRAGRWWWEDASKKECGLHVHLPTDAEKLQQA